MLTKSLLLLACLMSAGVAVGSWFLIEKLPHTKPIAQGETKSAVMPKSLDVQPLAAPKTEPQLKVIEKEIPPLEKEEYPVPKKEVVPMPSFTLTADEINSELAALAAEKAGIEFQLRVLPSDSADRGELNRRLADIEIRKNGLFQNLSRKGENP